MLLSVLILIIILRTIAHSTILCGGTLSALDPITAPEVTFIAVGAEVCIKDVALGRGGGEGARQ